MFLSSFPSILKCRPQFVCAPTVGTDDDTTVTVFALESFFPTQYTRINIRGEERDTRTHTCEIK